MSMTLATNLKIVFSKYFVNFCDNKMLKEKYEIAYYDYMLA